MHESEVMFTIIKSSGIAGASIILYFSVIKIVLNIENLTREQTFLLKKQIAYLTFLIACLGIIIFGLRDLGQNSLKESETVKTEVKFIRSSCRLDDCGFFKRKSCNTVCEKNSAHCSCDCTNRIFGICVEEKESCFCENGI